MSTEAETTSATGTVATPTKVAPAKEGSAPNTPSKETDEARVQLVQGRRHLLVKDYFSAVAALAKGCELLAQKFGDTAPELGDAYLTYGRALLELARSESGVLGMNEDGETGAEGEDDEEDGEEGEDGEDEAEDGEEEKDGAEAKENGEAGTEAKENGAKENGKEAEAKENGAKENGKEAEAKENGKEAEAKENGKEAEAKENGKEAEAKENGTEVKENGAEAKNGTDSETNGKETNGAADPDQTLKDDEEEDDVNNLQLAWEVLELAKGIFQKQNEDEKESKQICLKLAEVHLKLGEVGVESENYTTAVEDIKSCLELQKKYLDEDDRRIAETLYNMGMAYSLANEFDSAIEQFKLASAQIEKRIENLEKKKSEPAAAAEEKSATDDPFYTVQGEIDELKALLPEMKEKVSDMQDFKKETVRRMMEGLAEASAKQSSTADGAGPSSASASASASDKPVSSVAHLVKRKPKEDTPADKTEKAESSPTKTAEAKTEKAEPSPTKTTETKTEKKESSPAKTTEEKKESSPAKTTEEKKESSPAETTEEKMETEDVSDRKRKPEDSVETEEATKKAKVDESAESKPSE